MGLKLGMRYLGEGINLLGVVQVMAKVLGTLNKDTRKCTSCINLSTEKTLGLKAWGLFHKNGEIFLGL
ncbi:MAG: hypothetical protein R3B95_17920, partial [Nitrospirales bacterium]|nr:hypothetical protein [Nitrospirales bacterium]